jgi:hypothetical protein
MIQLCLYIHNMLYKVDIFAPFAVEQGKRLVYCYTIPPLYPSRYESISCVPLQHTSSRWRINTCSSVSFTPNENPGVCDAVESSWKKITYCMNSPEMPGVGQYCHRYVYATFMYARPYWGLMISSYRSWYSISHFLWMYISFPHKNVCFWSDPSRFFHPQNICALGQK